MELFGIALSIPIALTANMLYCLLLARVMTKFGRASHWLRLGSCFVLALFASEIVLLLTLGSTRSRDLFGSSFYVAHLAIFLLAAPALANLLVLPSRRGSLMKWYVAGTLCTVVAFVLVLLQYGVSESLYGIE